MSNVKESKEAVVGALKLGAFLYGKFKDGVQGADFLAILAKFENDPEFKQAIMDAYNDAEKIPAEFGAIDLAGGLELTAAVMKELPAVLNSMSMPIVTTDGPVEGGSVPSEAPVEA